MKIRTGVVGALNREWEALVASSRDELPPWADALFIGCRDLDDVLLTIRARPDPALLALLGAARTGGRWAGRTVVQALLGKMVLMAVRDSDASFEDYLAQLWVVIASYPVERRPRRVAANLVLDTRKFVRRERMNVPEVCVGDSLTELVEQLPNRVGRPAPATSEAAGILAAAHRLQLIDAPTGAILHTVYVEGLSSRDAAVRHDSSPAMVRYRCSRAVRRLTDHAGVLLDVA